MPAAEATRIPKHGARNTEHGIQNLGCANQTGEPEETETARHRGRLIEYLIDSQEAPLVLRVAHEQPTKSTFDSREN